MYNKGLKFPIFYFFFNDNLNIYSFKDLLIYNESLFPQDEIFTNKVIIEIINDAKGHEIYQHLLHYFLYLVQTPCKISAKDFNSKFIKNKSVFYGILKYTYVDFKIIHESLSKISKIAYVNEKLFYSELLKLLYKNFVIKLAKEINYSDDTDVKLFFDFRKDFKNFKNYTEQLKIYRPSQVKLYDFKREYIRVFYKSFNCSNIKEIDKKIIELNNYNYGLKKLFLKVVNDSIQFHSNITPNLRNKLFKPIYSQVMTSLSGRVLEGGDVLTKDIRTFFAIK